MRLKLLHGKLFSFFLAVVVFITPAGRRPGAAAWPAPLTLQSGFAQESVVVWGSPRSLPCNSSHGVISHSESDTKNMNSTKIQVLLRCYQRRKMWGEVFMDHNSNLWQNFTQESSWRHSHLLKSSWVVSGQNPHHCETISLWRKRTLIHRTFTSAPILVSCPTSSGYCSEPLSTPPPQSFPHRDPKGMMSGIVWACILNDRKAVPAPSARVH